MTAEQRPQNRKLAEDDSLPVQIEADLNQSTPEDLEWRLVGASQPSRATFHLNHSDVSPVSPDVLRPSDCPPDAVFALIKEVPIIIMDSLDKFWAGEAKSAFPLSGLRVPVEGNSIEEAKRNLAKDLAAQLRLLLLLSTSRKGQIAPQLQANLDLLRQYFAPNPNASG